MVSLGARIKELRLERAVSLRGFARAAGVAPSFASDIESGKRLPSPDTLASIADALGVSLAELQALDPRLSSSNATAFRLALAGEWEATLNHLGGLDGERVEQIRKAADLLVTAAHETLLRRNG